MPRKAKEIEEIKTKKTAIKSIGKKQEASKSTDIEAKKKIATSKKAATKRTPSKSTSSPKAKKTTSKVVDTKKNTTKKVKQEVNQKTLLEYYELPYRYNQTVVKILAQTPTTLFIYWEISDVDRISYQKEYGEDFFETTKPVLIIHNRTKDYTFEVEINDFANSWYLTVKDSKCNYKIELGRRPITKPLPNDYIPISCSNQIEVPNDHILLEKEQKMVYFRNVKNKQVKTKDMSNMVFLQNMGKIYNIYDFYQKVYQDAKSLSNPSYPTSTFQ